MLPPSATVAALPSCLHGYTPPADRFDECLTSAGTLRPAWTDLFAQLGDDPVATLRAASNACHRAVIEQEVNLNVYGDAQSAAHTWPLDVMPLLIDHESWATLSAGLTQRAHLYEALLQDLYGPQKLLKQGSLPAALAMANPQFLRACAGRTGGERGPMLQHLAVDVARSPDGRWWALEDRLDAPTGLGYALQNRIIVRQALGHAFRATPVERMYQFFQDYRASLRFLGGEKEDPRTVLLTPGVANEAYFEHTYLSRVLGYARVEGEDLTSRDEKIFLRTIGGLRQVDVILRRVDSDFCDPLELNANSLLGIPGLVQAAQKGSVALANALGNAALEGIGFLAFLPTLCSEVLGETLQLPSAATWWCGQTQAMNYVLENLETLVIKPAFGRVQWRARYGALLSARERDQLRQEIRARPHAYCGQERVFTGTAPAWEKDRLQPRPYILRVFLNWNNGRYDVLPGGLARFNRDGEDGLISMQRGFVSKDTWVLRGNGPDERPLMALSTHAVATAPADMPSRLADHLYWLGRYLERTRQISRLLEKLDPLLQDEIATMDPAVVLDAVRLALRLQDGIALPNASLEALVGKAHRIATETNHVGSLASNLRELSRILEIAKVHLPAEAWHAARRLRALTAAEQLTWVLPEIRAQLGGLDSLVAETLPRDTGWRFLDLGRRLERAMQLLSCVEAFCAIESESPLTEFRLQTLLNVTDSLFTYRTLYHGAYEIGPALACLFGASENPRSVCFQTDRIYEHLQLLPEEIAPTAVADLRAEAFDLAGAIRLANMKAMTEHPAIIAERAQEWSRALARLSDRLTQLYFVHLQQA